MAQVLNIDTHAWSHKFGLTSAIGSDRWNSDQLRGVSSKNRVFKFPDVDIGWCDGASEVSEPEGTCIYTVVVQYSLSN